MADHTEHLEAMAGVPASSSLPAAISADPTPETDTKYMENPADGRSNEKNPHKKRYIRTSEHFVRRVEYLQATFGFKDPLMVLMEIAHGCQINEKKNKAGEVIGTELVEFKKMPDHKTRVMAAAEIASYLYPKRKSVEVSGAEGQPISFSVVADQTAIPQMPSDEELEALSRQRRQQAIDIEKTIDAERE